jgi:hypothetical protein
MRVPSPTLFKIALEFAGVLVHRGVVFEKLTEFKLKDRQNFININDGQFQL